VADIEGGGGSSPPGNPARDARGAAQALILLRTP
jgi:hypothetical protein